MAKMVILRKHQWSYVLRYCATKYCDILHLSGEVRVIIISLSMSKGNASKHRYICRLENACEPEANVSR